MLSNIASLANVTPVNERTSQVAEEILNVVKTDYPSVNTYTDITATHLAAITSLNLRNKEITELKSGDFSGLTGLTNLNLYNNQLSSLPVGIFKGLISLTTIRLGGNTVDPLACTVSLEMVGDNQIKVVVPDGALFDIVLPIAITNGSIVGDATTLTIQKGMVESGTLTVTQTPDTTSPITVDIGTIPSLPSTHYGYTLGKSEDVPLDVMMSVNTAPVFTDGTDTTRSIAENTSADTNIGAPITATDTQTDTLAYTLSGTEATAFEIDSSTGQLKTKASLDYETKKATP
ncbi:leucine-rich repeat domain-containing protein [Candidatus Poribacteria bacterium]|nr:leucine-rich repeat domain-containing protein [Candidatus Poribacteria bacterium]